MQQQATDVILASDHRGFELKNKIKDFLREKKLFFVDIGVENSDRPLDSAPMPPIIKVVKEAAECVQSAKHMCGIFICGDGIAMSIAANRFRGIRAGLCRTVDGVKQARQHNDINVLCLGGESIDFEEAKKIVSAFLSTRPLEDVRYRKRQKLFDEMA
ncbi:MAG: RpiB/LacA/LacB family sugar-phosphate isomerase [Christensenellaceae bacterium]|jgi:ribose 5-phosphate isomerase B|nr:RpiB/LacA/LacB family sugar-phosphate isomerase [Christensenellaceae bacterium]